MIFNELAERPATEVVIAPSVSNELLVERFDPSVTNVV